ncbi:hypothetical protein JOD43_003740 [Pullulanibacillus pueri]|uniref:Uncharacterized protein n=1 Tax=Pullulanibacillus pueri TaxID=1437324 RepID=A0A8J2ZYZ8_9BACL|nr:hypothetical protein [Pullulanibacillus pueri]MBM7683560.1 hypothetical protein [Pullulanibacillus pueri]GGH86815.1 hypothetical protein GCM10007096_35390 [Pullulanibacillus pueri]
MTESVSWIRNMYTGPGGGVYKVQIRILIGQYIHYGHYLLLNFVKWGSKMKQK